MLVLPALTLMLSACDWTEFGYNASGGRSSADTGISLSNVAGTKFDWSYYTGNTVISSPAEANGIRLCRFRKRQRLRAERDVGGV